MHFIGQLIGGLIATFILSRLALWTMKSWNGGIQKILLGNGIALLIATLLGGMGMTDGGAFAAPQAFMAYVLPQAIWTGFDLWRHKKGKAPLAFGK